jgi:hypothetical protein
MPHPLQQRLALLRGRVRRLLVVYGLSRVVTMVLGCIILLAAVDYLVRFQDRGIRVIGWLALWVVAGWVVYRYLYRVLAHRFSDAQLALRVQRRFPALGDSLLSAVEFLRQSPEDPTAGSAALRRIAVAETAAHSEPLDFAEVLDRRPIVRSVTAMAAVCWASLMLVVLDPASCRVGLIRLMYPFGKLTWPQPERPDLPKKAIEPPLVESLAVRLIPPSYTGWPPQDSDRQIRALLGTQLLFSGQASQPLASAALVFQDGRKIPAVLDDPRHFRVPGDAAKLIVEKSQSYWFCLTDRETHNSHDSDRWEIFAMADRPPSVNIEEPGADTFVTPEAELPLRVTANDDLALHEVALVFDRSDRPRAGPGRETIYLGPPRVKPPAAAGLAGGTAPGERLSLDYRWKLAPLELRPHVEVTFYATATDYRPSTAKSPLRRLRVITPQELESHVASRESLILAQLARVLKLQQDHRVQVAGLAARLGAAGQLAQFDVDHLQAAALGQRQIDEALAGRGEGVAGQVRALLADLENNRLGGLEIRRRMQRLLAEIARLEKEHLPSIAQDLTAAIKAAQVALEDDAPRKQATDQPAAPAPLLSAALAHAVEHQDQVIASLLAMLGQLGQWDHYRHFHHEMAGLLREEEELGRRTAESARDTLTRELKDLSPPQLAGLKDLARGQLELALRLDQLQEAMRQASRQMTASDPSAAQTLAEAADTAQRLAIGAAMRTALGNLERNQMGEAVAAQQEIIEHLYGVLDILAGRGQPATAGEQDNRRENALRHLRQEQQTLLRQTQGLDARRPADGQWPADALARLEQTAHQQQALQRESGRLGETQHGSPLALALVGVADDMDRAWGLLDRRQTGRPTQQAQQEALERLGLILDALAPEPAAKPTGEASGGPGSGRPAAPGKQLTLAELKVLKLLQQEVNHRTEQIQRAFGAVGAREEYARRQYDKLSGDQGALADLVAGPRPAQAEPPVPSAQPADPLDQSLFDSSPSPKSRPAQPGRAAAPGRADQHQPAGKLAAKPAPAGASGEEPLGGVARQMRQAQQRLGQGDSGRPTQAIQREILAALDAIVREARSRGPASPAGPPQVSSTTERGPIASPRQSPQQEAKPGRPTGSAAGKPGVQAPPQQQPEQAQIGDLMRSLWGELPAKQREQMRQAPAEEFLPKYESMLEAYFRRLAQQREKGAP